MKRHRLRTALTFFGIALGVAVIVAIAAVNRSLTTSFQSTIDQIAGKAVLQVANGESGIAESLFPLIRDTAGVRDASAAVEGFSPVAGVPGERLYVYGVDLLRISRFETINSSMPSSASIRRWILSLNRIRSH